MGCAAMCWANLCEASGPRHGPTWCPLGIKGIPVRILRVSVCAERAGVLNQNPFRGLCPQERVEQPPQFSLDYNDRTRRSVTSDFLLDGCHEQRKLPNNRRNLLQGQPINDVRTLRRPKIVHCVFFWPKSPISLEDPKRIIVSRTGYFNCAMDQTM